MGLRKDDDHIETLCVYGKFHFWSDTLYKTFIRFKALKHLKILGSIELESAQNLIKGLCKIQKETKRHIELSIATLTIDDPLISFPIIETIKKYKEFNIQIKDSIYNSISS